MKYYFKLVINKTAKPMGKAKKENVFNQWQSYDQEVKEFNTLKEIKEYLEEQYFYCKTKYPFYIDNKKGEAVKNGFIYAFRSEPRGYDDCWHFEQHWINVYKIKSQPILI